MSLYAIADLHLSSTVHKPMDIFGDIWFNHQTKIEINWNNIVSKEDTVLVLGDISWAMKLADAKSDLDFIDKLNGNKILISGNHDYWWGKTGKLNSLYENMFFLKKDFATFENFAICGTKGWLCPQDTFFKEEDAKKYEIEVDRLKLSLELAMNASYKDIIVVLHFPPTNDKKEPSGFTKLIQQYNVKKVIYGHLHGENSYGASLMGFHDGIQYDLVSADFLNFNPKFIL